MSPMCQELGLAHAREWLRCCNCLPPMEGDGQADPKLQHISVIKEKPGMLWAEHKSVTSLSLYPREALWDSFLEDSTGQLCDHRQPPPLPCGLWNEQNKSTCLIGLLRGENSIILVKYLAWNQSLNTGSCYRYCCCFIERCGARQGGHGA